MTLRTRGIVLILISALLTLLASLVVMLAILQRTHRESGVRTREQAQSQLLAVSGMERAVSELSRGATPSYGGEDYNGDGVKNISGPEVNSQVWRPATFEIETCPVSYALRPSFFSRRDGEINPGGTPAPDRTLVHGKELGFSGRLRSPYCDTRRTRGSTYGLKIEDESAKINVNGGLLDAQNRDEATGDLLPDYKDPDVALAGGERIGWNRQLARILNVLGTAPEIGIASLGQRILENRPEGGYSSLEQVYQRTGIAGKDLSPYLTVSSWVDRKVVRPNAWRQTARDIPSAEKRIRGALYLEEGGRPPVNLNAANRAVLVSLLDGISVQNDFACIYYIMGTFTPAAVCRVSPLQAGRIADQIVAARRTAPFTNWARFGTFLEGLVPTGQISGFQVFASGGAPTDAGQLGAADMILANFDPNTRSKLQYPDQILWHWHDKTELLDYSTEGEFGPTGCFRITSVGRLVDWRSRNLSETVLAGIVEAFTPVRHTSQRDFVGGRTPVQEDPPGSGNHYLSRTQLPHWTTGRSAGTSWWGGVPPTASLEPLGVGAMTYPCPMTAANAGNASESDGYVGLATTEIRPASPVLYPGAQTRFLAHFDDGWDAKMGIVPGRQQGSADLGHLAGTRPDERLPLGVDLTIPVWPGSGDPNTLFPDGAQLQWHQCPAYSALNLPEDDADSDHGTLSYWVKRRANDWSSVMSDFSCIRYDTPPPYRSTTVPSQVLLTGGGRESAGLVYESLGVTGQSADTGVERDNMRRCNPGVVLGPGFRWHFVSVFFDTDEPYGNIAGHDLHAYLGGAFASTLRNTVRYPASLDRSRDRSIRRDPVTGDPDPDLRFVLGGRISTFQPTVYRPDHILDEFAINDFGDAGSTSQIPSNEWADATYQDGRYYKGNDAVFLSAIVTPALSGPARIVRARWTEYLPTQPRLEPKVDGLGVLLGGAPNPNYGACTYTPRYIDPFLAGNDAAGKPRVRLEMELLDASGTLLQTLDQGAWIGRSLSDFRYRVRFRTVLVDPDNQPVLETQFLDDITFYCQGSSGPGMLHWLAQE